MKGNEFAARASKALGGHGWQTRFARGIGKDTSTVRRWLDEETDAPEHAVAILEFLEAIPAAMRPARWLK